MKRTVKHAFALVTLLSVSIFMSCGDDGGGDTKTPKEELIEALSGKTFTADVTATNVSGVSGAPDASTFTVTFSTTDAGLAFTLAGDVEDYITGGSFAVSDEGDLSNFAVTAATTDLSATVSSITVNSERTQVSMTINVTEAGSRVGGVGQYILVFVAG